MSTNRLASVGTGKQGAGTRIRLDLIDDQDSDVELFGHLAEFTEVLAEFSLTFVQLAAAVEVVAEVRHDAVDDEKAVLP